MTGGMIRGHLLRELRRGHPDHRGAQALALRGGIDGRGARRFEIGFQDVPPEYSWPPLLVNESSAR
jgi:hypothetical protein